MSYGSYYESDPNYYRNPVPYLGSDIGAPVPGWGTSIQVAGPARLGVGAGPTMLVKAADVSKTLTYKNGVSTTTTGDAAPGEQAPPSEVGGMPWWVWPIAAAVVMGGVGYYGTKKGWF